MRKIVIMVISLMTGFAGGYMATDKQNTAKPVETKQEKSRQKSALQRTDDELAQLVRQIDNLEIDLLAASKEIVDLTRQNQSLAQLVEQMHLPGSTSTINTALLERIDKLPVGIIKQQLTYLFDEEYISKIENPHEFSKSLIEVALIQEQDAYYSGSANIVFSYSPIVGWREMSADITIDQFDTLYAHISPTRSISNAMLKWQHDDSGEILIFSPLALDIRSQSQYVVIRPDNGWLEGRYRVTIHDMDSDSDRKLVAANSFHISAVRRNEENGNARRADDDILQDLIMTGRAVPKIYQ